jgi:threonine dehydratase
MSAPDGVPQLADVLGARRRIAPHLPRTPLRNYPLLDELVGTEVHVKHENHLPTGAFKVRGGINLISTLAPSERRAGVLAASTGNHGQSVAYAARLFGAPASIFVPEASNPVKLASMRALGAEVIEGGADFNDAVERCESEAARRGGRYVHSGNEPLLIAGVATGSLESLEDRPDLDVLVLPIGGGSGAAGACVVARAVRPELEVIGVQSEAAPSAYRSWSARALVEDRIATAAEGLATRVPFELPQAILWDRLDDFVLVSEDELRQAALHLIELTRNLVELAGAAALAAALKLRERLAGRRVGVVCSGGNISPAQLAELLAGGR